MTFLDVICNIATFADDFNLYPKGVIHLVRTQSFPKN